MKFNETILRELAETIQTGTDIIHLPVEQAVIESEEYIDPSAEPIEDYYGHIIGFKIYAAKNNDREEVYTYMFPKMYMVYEGEESLNRCELITADYKKAVAFVMENRQRELQNAAWWEEDDADKSFTGDWWIYEVITETPLYNISSIKNPAPQTPLKLVSISDEQMVFEGAGSNFVLRAVHETECYEHHYLDFDAVTTTGLLGTNGKPVDLSQLEWGFSTGIPYKPVEGEGIVLMNKPENPDVKIFIPGRGSNNGYYSSDLTLTFEEAHESMNKTIWMQDISECQDIERS